MEDKIISIGRLIGTKSNLLRRLLDSKFADCPYSGAETRCLSMIIEWSNHGKENVFQKDVEQVFNMRSSTATELIKGLEEKGLLTKESIENDGRKKRLIPTEKAEKINLEILDKLNNVEKTISRNISEKDMEIYLKVTNQIIENLQ